MSVVQQPAPQQLRQARLCPRAAAAPSASSVPCACSQPCTNTASAKSGRLDKRTTPLVIADAGRGGEPSGSVHSGSGSSGTGGTELSTRGNRPTPTSSARTRISSPRDEPAHDRTFRARLAQALPEGAEESVLIRRGVTDGGEETGCGGRNQHAAFQHGEVKRVGRCHFFRGCL